MTSLIQLEPYELGLPDRYDSFRPCQLEALEFALDAPERFVGLGLPPGCHGDPNAKVLTSIGESKKVSDVVVGDRLMGPSGVRTVLSLCRGNGRLYEVIPVKGSSFVVNEDHVLTVVKTAAGTHYPCDLGGAISDIPVHQYLEMSAYSRSYRKLFRSCVSEFEDEEKEYPIDPYLLGILLGDGGLKYGSACLHKADPELLPELHRATSKYGIVPKPLYDRGRFAGWRLSNGTGQDNLLLSDLESLGLRGKGSEAKFLPQPYWNSNAHQRLEILAGLLDTDGHMSKGGYDFISQSERLSEAVCFLARSVGLAAYLKPCEKFCQTGAGGTYYRVSVSGDCSIIPVRIERKKAPARQQKKDVLRTGFELKRLGSGEYWGFTLDGDGRYLLDDFTVTHNSGKTVLATALAKASGLRTVILTATKGLQDQYADERYGLPVFDMRGKSNYDCNDKQNISCRFGKQEGCRWHRRVRNAAGDFEIVDPSCTHEGRKRQAQREPIVVTNYANWFRLNQFTRGLEPPEKDGSNPVEMLILDESHLVFSALSNSLQVVLLERRLHELGFKPTDYPQRDFSVDTWAEWSGAASQVTKEALEEAIFHLRSAASKEDRTRARNRVYQLEELKEGLDKLSRMNSKDWVMERQDGTDFGRRWQFDCVWPGAWAEARLFFGIPKVVFMSGTLRPQHPKMLGVKREELAFREWPWQFPKQNTPIYHVKTVRLNSKTGEDDKQKWIARIDEILEMEFAAGSKGLIHTVSYDRAKYIAHHSRFSLDFFMNGNDPDSPDAAQVFEDYSQAEGPAALVSPSFGTGWDFAGKLASFIIVAKLPFPDFRSKVMQARLARSPQYTDMLCMQDLVQSCLRGSRSEEDICRVYLIDDSITYFMKKAKGLAPGWFRVMRVNEVPKLKIAQGF